MIPWLEDPSSWIIYPIGYPVSGRIKDGWLIDSRIRPSKKPNPYLEFFRFWSRLYGHMIPWLEDPWSWIIYPIGYPVSGRIKDGDDDWSRIRPSRKTESIFGGFVIWSRLDRHMIPWLEDPWSCLCPLDGRCARWLRAADLHLAPGDAWWCHSQPRPPGNVGQLTGFTGAHTKDFRQRGVQIRKMSRSIVTRDIRYGPDVGFSQKFKLFIYKDSFNSCYPAGQHQFSIRSDNADIRQ